MLHPDHGMTSVLAVISQMLRLTMFFTIAVLGGASGTYFPNGRLKANPSPLFICIACTEPALCCQLLSPASGAYLGRAHSVADVHEIAHSVLAVGYPKLPAVDSTGEGTVLRLAHGNQCSCTSGRMITACALRSVMGCTFGSTVTGVSKQSPRDTIVPFGVTALFWLKRKGNVLPPPTLPLYLDLLGLSPPQLLAGTRARNRVVFEWNKMPIHR